MVVRLIDWAGVVRVVAFVVPGDSRAFVVKIKGGVDHAFSLVISKSFQLFLISSA